MVRKIVYIFFIIIQSQYLVYSQPQIISITQQLSKIDVIKNDSIAFGSLEALVKSVKLDIRSQLEINRRMVARANLLEKFNKAIAIANESMVLAAKNGMDSLEAVFNKLLGASYYYMDRRAASIPYFERAIVITHKNDLWELEASCLNNIGGALADIQRYDSAESYLLKSIAIMKAHHKENVSKALLTYRVLARVYSENGKPDKAEPLYLELIGKSKEIKDTVFLADNLLFYSQILIRRGEADRSVAMSAEALAIKRKAKNAHELQMAMDIHSSNLSKAGRHKEAFDLLQERSILMRTTFAKDLEKEIGEVEVKYKTAQLRQEKELAEIKAKKQRQVYIFSFLGVLILGLSGSYLWNQRKKAKHLSELAEIEKLRFKDVIEAEEKERSRIAQELHDGLGQLLSTARLNVAGLEDSVAKEDQPDLQRSLKIIDDACVEVRSISHNMMPSALIRLGLIPAIQEVVNNVNSAKGIKIDFETNVNSSLGQSLDITIYRVVQEILNNMIKHAKANHINMTINRTDNNLQISIKDDGVGFDPDELKESKGMGWKNIFSRVSMLDGSIKLESELDKGTTVYIDLKLSRRDANAKNGK